MRQIPPLEADSYYHIYNRGINGEDLFKEEKNYTYFLERYAYYLSPVLDTYAYCLMKNHFHLLVRIKAAPPKPAHRQFSNCFNSYTQAINKRYQRHGALFERPFKRKKVITDSYLTTLIYYIHHNPQQHGFVADFRDYPHSSYQSHLQLSRPTRLQRGEVLAWFGNAKEYLKFHRQPTGLPDITDLTIEED